MKKYNWFNQTIKPIKPLKIKKKMENKKSIKQQKSEVMNIEKAINRLQWRFKNENVKINESKIIINQLDVNAVDFLSEWINNQKKEMLMQNILFAKMYAYSLFHEIVFYKGNAKLANIKLQEQLKLPIEFHYDNVHKILNTFFLNNFGNEKGISDKHPATRTKEEDENQKQIIKEFEKEFEELIIGRWEQKEVYKALNNQITECINKYKLMP